MELKCHKCKESRRVAPFVKCDKCENCVKPGGLFFRHPSNNRWRICNTCYNLEGRDVKVPTDKNNNNGIAGQARTTPFETLKKNEFRVDINQAHKPEPKVRCVKCLKTYHRACVNFVVLKGIIPKGEFTCDGCRPDGAAELNFDYQSVATPKNLSETHLSKFIEVRVNGFLTKRDAKYIHVRVLSYAEAKYQLGTGTLYRFLRKHYDVPTEFNYRSRLIACFQEAEHDESVMFFVVYSQEYGPNCPEPNKNSVYIAMLDSARIFEPRDMRQNVHWLVVLLYLRYMRDKGFEHTYLWACVPASPEVEYVFQRRPTTQKQPTPKRLNEWYESMMRYGKKMRIVEEFKYLCDLLIPANTEQEFFAKFPLFKDDFWPEQLREIIKLNENERGNGPPKKKKAKRISVFQATKRQLRDKKPRFLYLKLKENQQEMINESEESDPLISSKLVDIRDNLVNFLIVNGLEFQDDRKAMHATKTVLLHLWVEAPEFICDDCSGPMMSLWFHCKICCKHICQNCRRRKHPHKSFLDFKEVIPSFKKAAKNKKLRRRVAQLDSCDRFNRQELIEAEDSQSFIDILETYYHLQTCAEMPCALCLISVLSWSP